MTERVTVRGGCHAAEARRCSRWRGAGAFVNEDGVCCRSNMCRVRWRGAASTNNDGAQGWRRCCSAKMVAALLRREGADSFTIEDGGCSCWCGVRCGARCSCDGGAAGITDLRMVMVPLVSAGEVREWWPAAAIVMMFVNMGEVEHKGVKEVYKRQAPRQRTPVSDTHLEVYKRQAPRQRTPVSDTHLEVYKRQAPRQRTPVSDTHLEVYKRQAPRQRTPVSDTHLEVYKRQAPRQRTPVSDTHLEVYKRQAPRQRTPVSDTHLERHLVLAWSCSRHPLSARVPFDCHVHYSSYCAPRSRVEVPWLFSSEEQRRDLSISPRRDETGSSPEFLARKVARAARSTFERAGNSPRREGSRLSEIPRCSGPCLL
ncbi:hypothetical protein DEO72_LG8g1565 [Vigna unguiculata]|uniref:Uncharacterized protein n=1 Tax=Vigna unguiculata TaxID=3917 RepID=A0A4D6MPR7_VIGUN|nr:hypothetical protein DEO72_LG8g1565 [Vigna unguiculata]